MPVAHLLRERTIGETRWVALDANGVAVALYLEREHEAARRAVLGERLDAQVRRIDTALGGAFVDLGARGEAFLRLKSGETFAEGAAIRVEVVAEARRKKLARVRLATTDDTAANSRGSSSARPAWMSHWRARESRSRLGLGGPGRYPSHR